MEVKDSALAIVATVPSEVEGQLLANILNDRGIPAAVTGGLTSQFRTEAPGWVRVMVKQESLSAAQAVLAERATRDPFPEAPVEDGESSAHEPRLTRFGIWSLLIGESFVIVGSLAFLAMGGNLVGGIGTLLVSAGLVAAILTRRRR
jgi:hypothetical protein